MYRSISLPFIFLLFTACSGGGSGSSGPPAPPPGSSASNDALTVNEDATADINVTANDTNVDPSSVFIIEQPAHGIATIPGDTINGGAINSGTITYTPDENFNGTDSVRYTVDSNNNTGSNSATLTITVNSINDAPVATDDSAQTTINKAIEITVINNDSDVDGDSLSAEIVDAAANGSAAVLPDGIVSYVPAPGFIGQDDFTYQAVDPSGDTSNTVTVTITVAGLTSTNLVIQELTIPTTGYADVPVGIPGDFIFASPLITFDVDPNVVSFVVNLIGSSVQQPDSLSIIGVRNPQGILLNFRDTVFCDLGLCTIQVPKRPGIEVEDGRWALRLGTLSNSTDVIDFNDYKLQLVSRIGPAPGIDSRTSLAVKPFATGVVSTEDIDEVLKWFSDMTNANDIDVVIEPLTIIGNPRFAEVDTDFRDEDTSALVLMGDPTKINLFFLEGFSDAGGGGLLGIAGGLPGALGLESEYNGVLINGLATMSSDKDFYHRTTAEFAFHEMSHLLGLYHTTEADFSGHDILIDTPDCHEIHDTNSNRKADAGECLDGLNLMFWENDLREEKTGLTADQKHVIRSSVVSIESGVFKPEG